jgi:hypothetical protein
MRLGSIKGHFRDYGMTLKLNKETLLNLSNNESLMINAGDIMKTNTRVYCKTRDPCDTFNSWFTCTRCATFYQSDCNNTGCIVN